MPPPPPPGDPRVFTLFGSGSEGLRKCSIAFASLTRPPLDTAPFTNAKTNEDSGDSTALVPNLYLFVFVFSR